MSRVSRTRAGSAHRNTLVLSRGRSHISVLLRSNSGAVPLRNRRYRIYVADRMVLEGVTDAEGLVSHPNVPAGDHRLEIEGFDNSVWVPTLPLNMERRTLRVPGYILFPDDRYDESRLSQDGEDDSEVIERDIWETEDESLSRDAHARYSQ
jgi:hypothetical protein